MWFYAQVEEGRGGRKRGGSGREGGKVGDEEGG
jgi:hypothetical protein